MPGRAPVFTFAERRFAKTSMDGGTDSDEHPFLALSSDAK
jgi:hypothetical protein